MPFAGLKDIALFALAIYGAVLSTWNLVQALRKEKRAVRVTAGSKIPVDGDGRAGNTWAHLEATNIGQRPVTITMIAFEAEGGGRIFRGRSDHRPAGLEDTPLPITLTDGQTARLHYSYDEVGRALISNGQTRRCKLTPVCEDSSGGLHRGEAWDVTPSELMKM